MFFSTTCARSIECAALFVLAAAAGCKKEPSLAPATAEQLTLVQGNAQVRQAGRLLRTPLVFRATGSDGKGVAGVGITIVVAQGGGSVDSASIKTDNNGEARVKWTLGPDAAQALLATVPGLEPLRVTATGLLPTDIVVAQGNNQSAKVGIALPNSVVIRVLGAGNVPMDSVNVTFQITGGGGAITPQSILTNAQGEATARWTVGPVAGINTAAVRAASLDAVTLTATATP
jgi:hypothetical protein